MGMLISDACEVAGRLKFYLMIVQPVFEFLAIGNVQQGGIGFCCLDGDAGFAQQTLAEEMDGGACADRQFYSTAPARSLQA